MERKPLLKLYLCFNTRQSAPTLTHQRASIPANVLQHSLTCANTRHLAHLLSRVQSLHISNLCNQIVDVGMCRVSKGWPCKREWQHALAPGACWPNCQRGSSKCLGRAPCTSAAAACRAPGHGDIVQCNRFHHYLKDVALKDVDT